MLRRRMITVGLATMAVLLLFTGTAFAHYCTNVSKKASAGNAGVLLIEVDPETDQDSINMDLTTARLTKTGQISGGFYDVHVDFTGDGVADFVANGVYAHAGLPEGALAAAGCGQATETQLAMFFGELACP